jgi:hypothetical protein
MSPTPINPSHPHLDMNSVRRKRPRRPYPTLERVAKCGNDATIRQVLGESTYGSLMAHFDREIRKRAHRQRMLWYAAQRDVEPAVKNGVTTWSGVCTYRGTRGVLTVEQKVIDGDEYGVVTFTMDGRTVFWYDPVQHAAPVVSDLSYLCESLETAVVQVQHSDAKAWATRVVNSALKCGARPFPLARACNQLNR